MNIVVLLLGLFFTIEGFSNVLFFRAVPLEQHRFHKLFQAGRLLRAFLGLVCLIYSFFI